MKERRFKPFTLYSRPQSGGVWKETYSQWSGFRLVREDARFFASTTGNNHYYGWTDRDGILHIA